MKRVPTILFWAGLAAVSPLRAERPLPTDSKYEPPRQRAGEPADDGVAFARVVSWGEMLENQQAGASATVTQLDRDWLSGVHRSLDLDSADFEVGSLGTSQPGEPAGGVPLTPPRIGLRFPAANFGWTGLTPPDTMGAIGPRHFVEIINGSVAVYDRRSGLRVSRVSLPSFFAIVPGFKFDPRVIFDAPSGRWIAIAARSPGNTPDPFGVCMGVSRTDDPLGQWFQFFFSDPLHSSSLHDFPMLGVGPDGIYVGMQLFPPAQKRLLWAFEKAPLVSTTQRLGAVNIWRYENTEPLPVPVHSLGTLGEDMVVGLYRPTSTFTLYFVDGTAAQPTLRLQGVFQGPPAPQVNRLAPTPFTFPDVGVDTGNYLSSVPVYRNRTLWFALRIDVGGRSAVHWMKVLPYLSPPRVVDADTVADPSLHFYFPSLAVNAANDMVMAFSGSDRDTFISAYYTGRRGTDLIASSAPATLLKAGEAVYGTDPSMSLRWGDYSATSVDPLDDLTFWTIQQYAGFHAQPNFWGLWAASLSFRLTDCNANQREDACDIDCDAGGCSAECGKSQDCQGNGVPDECETPTDCNDNGEVDSCEVALGSAKDCNQNGLPDECDPSHDCNANGIPDECEPDCNANTFPDDCDIDLGTSRDCNANGMPDECERRPNSLVHADPPDGMSLPRSEHNAVRLTFLCDLPFPPLLGRDIVVAELVTGGSFGNDLSAGFDLIAEDARTIRLVDRLGILQPNKWYSVSTSNWDGMQRFNLTHPILVGDVDGNARVLYSDVGRINAAVPTLAVDPLDRRDINGDGAILANDLAVVVPLIPAKTPSRPDGHGN